MSRCAWGCVAAALFLNQSAALAQDTEGVDPLTVAVQTEDAERFAELFARTDGRPTAEQLQRDYLTPAGPGIAIFTPNRIVDARNLAAAIAKAPTAYRRAVEVCLPLVRRSDADLRSIYLGLRGALPDARLPAVYAVFGANNSGGTAGPGAQVIGLEVLCQLGDDEAAIRRELRRLYAHETVHTLQTDDPASETDPLLAAVLAEGAADFLARLVTGEEPDAERAAWAEPREAELWERLLADVDLSCDGTAGPSAAERSISEEATRRWVGNYGSAPGGWPSELGYWMGLRIWERVYDAASDKRAVLDAVLRLTEPRSILAAGAFNPPTSDQGRLPAQP